MYGQGLYIQGHIENWVEKPFERPGLHIDPQNKIVLYEYRNSAQNFL